MSPRTKARRPSAAHRRQWPTRVGLAVDHVDDRGPEVQRAEYRPHGVGDLVDVADVGPRGVPSRVLRTSPSAVVKETATGATGDPSSPCTTRTVARS